MPLHYAGSSQRDALLHPVATGLSCAGAAQHCRKSYIGKCHGKAAEGVACLMAGGILSKLSQVHWNLRCHPAQ